LHEQEGAAHMVSSELVAIASSNKKHANLNGSSATNNDNYQRLSYMNQVAGVPQGNNDSLRDF
jgi:hypothetical protein